MVVVVVVVVVNNSRRANKTMAIEHSEIETFANLRSNGAMIEWSEQEASIKSGAYRIRKHALRRF